MFDEYQALVPFKEAAEILADRNWGSLYDQQRLRDNEVPIAAAIYADDMYVESAFSLETAATLGNARYWLTNEYEHDALTVDGPRVITHLLDLVESIRSES